ncbi:hypothetical protein R3P38DRAFT_3342416 [Favolaschia claudopus]|uniref:Uncharacterized protein n=1 Tax=Favolaschia claudopus TaxID=2862362 RepID=A0AAW0DTL1_9AGAR
MTSPAYGVAATAVLLSHLFIIKVLCHLSPAAFSLDFFPDIDFKDHVPYVFESLVCTFLLAIWFSNRTVGAQIIKLFTRGTLLLLGPVLLAPCLGYLRALQKVVSGVQVPHIYIKAIAFWTSLFRQTCQRVVSGASCSLDIPPFSPMSSAIPVCSSAARAARASKTVHYLDAALFTVIDTIFCRISFLCHQCITTGLSCVARLAKNAVFRPFTRLKDILSSSFAAVERVVTGLHLNFKNPGSTNVDPRLEAVCIYAFVFTSCFVASAYMHLFYLHYSFRSAMVLAAGWGLAGVLAFYNAAHESSSLKPPPTTTPTAVPRTVARPVIQHQAIPSCQSPPGLVQPETLIKSPISSVPSSPTSNTSTVSSVDSDPNTDWSLIPRPLTRRSLIDFPTSDLHRALSPIMEVSSVASTYSIATSRSATPSPCPSPKNASTPPRRSSSRLATSPIHSSSSSSDERTAARVNKARAQRDMAEFRSFSMALQDKTQRVRAGAGGDELQSNAAGSEAEWRGVVNGWQRRVIGSDAANAVIASPYIVLQTYWKLPAYVCIVPRTTPIRSYLTAPSDVRDILVSRSMRPQPDKSTSQDKEQRVESLSKPRRNTSSSFTRMHLGPSKTGRAWALLGLCG